ncbi:MAG TPA: hypothetical protein VFQ53_13030 [Kofleriaceae bacterium]|nr:hypothetical protein [Kofleriaceae bacterium]
MTIRIWHAFSCNNSSSYRIVARFADPRAAREAADELATFFDRHARELEALRAADDWDTETAASQALAARYGFAWDDVLVWGSGAALMSENEPEIAAEAGVVLVYHGYCNGLGEGELVSVLRARGALDVEHEETLPPHVSLVFVPSADPRLAAELDALFAPLVEQPADVALDVPWPATWRPEGIVCGFRDPGAVGLYLPFVPRDLPAIRQWLADRGVTRYAFRLCDDADEARFAAIARARCTACEARLDYLDPRIHDIDTEQLACRACGGLYDLAAFVVR